MSIKSELSDSVRSTGLLYSNLKSYFFLQYRILAYIYWFEDYYLLVKFEKSIFFLKPALKFRDFIGFKFVRAIFCLILFNIISWNHKDHDRILKNFAKQVE
ncbi:hypothetical protein BpHYR1_025797 [Brachionus plicatilis]|uniref:Uncharacterized protein n=1 Tax=Brachionus plicatilis TaxID=10195 RepID=A0A3M7P8I9_BRAPC|nr:hypothetical protein BpHYR1_025797 [Brachionus plicatilis]